MGLINQERFINRVTEMRPHHEMRLHLAHHMYEQELRGMLNDRHVMIDRASAVRVYDELKRYIKQNGAMYAKTLRPWDLDQQLYADLDRSEVWWGFEFETGYGSRDERASVIEDVWNRWDNVCFDTEGEAAAVEITFAPQERSKYLNGTASAIEFIQMLTGDKRVANMGEENVGTHINMSSPTLTDNNLHDVAWSLARTLAALPISVDISGVKTNTRQFMFGRRNLYGGIFPQSQPNAVWLEGKLFRTTYDIKMFERYLKVCEGLTKCMELFTKMPRCRSKGEYVDNLYEVCFEDAEPVVKASPVDEIPDGVRSHRNTLNGFYARDTWNGKATWQDMERERVQREQARLAARRAANNLIW